MARGRNLCKIADHAMFPVLKEKRSKSMKPIRKPRFCNFSGEVKNGNDYRKSFCMDKNLRTFEESQAFCLENSMRLYQIDSSNASVAIIDFARKELAQFSNLFVYVDGNKSSDACTNINNKERSFKFDSNDCEMELRSICEFVDVES